MHGFCTDFARFQTVQMVQIVAKLDKGCRNCWVKNYVALIKNNDNSKLPETETNRRLALLISGSWVRVPDGAPQNTSHEAAGYFLLLVFEGTAVSVHQRGLEQLAAAVTESRSRRSGRRGQAPPKGRRPAVRPAGQKQSSGLFLERRRVPDA